MNEIEQRWIGESEERREILGQALANGFRLVEVGASCALVYGKDADKIEFALGHVRVTKGETAYGLRSEGLPWAEVGDKTGSHPSNACLMAKRWSKQKGLPWPPV